MAPLHRVVSDFRGWLIVLGVMALLAAVAYGGFVYPLRSRVEAAERRATTSAASLRSASQQELAAKRLVTGKDQAARDLERFYAQVLPVDRASARRVAYLRLAELAERANLDSARRTVTVDRDKNGRLERMDVSMTLRGEYADIRRFIHDVETSRDFVVIRGLELVQRDSGETELEVAVQLATFYSVPDGQ